YHFSDFVYIWTEHSNGIKDPKIVNAPFNTTEIASNSTGIPEIYPYPYEQLSDNLTYNLLNGFIALICILGLVGNGRTIYLLAFSIKRNPFTTFILNLSIADFGVITSLIMAAIFVTVQFLLTAISLDRCVAALFPLWHRCHRHPNLSTLVCVLIWILSFLLSAVHFILYQTKSLGGSHFLYQLIVNGCAAVNSSINPLLYFLVGRKKRGKDHARASLKLALQRVFNDEQDNSEESKTTEEDQL
ncbi:hypothetical protein E2320_000211, partial [Naja naja]